MYKNLDKLEGSISLRKYLENKSSKKSHCGNVFLTHISIILSYPCRRNYFSLYLCFYVFKYVVKRVDFLCQVTFPVFPQKLESHFSKKHDYYMQDKHETCITKSYRLDHLQILENVEKDCNSVCTVKTLVMS